MEPEEFAPRFYDFVPRIIDERFLLRKETEEDRAYRNLQNRVGIDVFLTYGIPAGGLRKKLAVARLLAVYGLGMGHRYRLDYTKYSLPQKIAAALLSTAGRLVPAKAVCRRYFRLITRYDRQYHDLYWKTYNDPKETIRREWTEETAEGELRGRKFPVPAGYDAELTALYGDYMKPPADRSAYQQHLDEEDRWREKTPSKEGQSE